MRRDLFGSVQADAGEYPLVNGINKDTVIKDHLNGFSSTHEMIKGKGTIQPQKVSTYEALYNDHASLSIHCSSLVKSTNLIYINDIMSVGCHVSPRCFLLDEL